MAGEREVLNAAFDVLRREQLDWLIASAVNDWNLGGLDTSIAEDNTTMAARQILSLADTIEATLVPEIEALAYLRRVTPDAVFQDARQSLASARPIEPIDRTPTALPAAAGAFREFAQMVRTAVADDWPDLRSELG